MTDSKDKSGKIAGILPKDADMMGDQQGFGGMGMVSGVAPAQVPAPGI